MESSPRKFLRDAFLAERGAQHLELMHEVRHELRELVHGLFDLNQRVFALFIYPADPDAMVSSATMNR